MSTLLINAVLFGAMLFWTLRAPAAMREIAERAIWCFWAVVGVEILSGFARRAADWPALVALHFGAGHLLLMLAWAIAGASIALLIRHFRQQRGTALLFCLVSFAMFVATTLATLTGYLDPFAPDADQEARNRFFVLHGCIAPAVLALAVPFWIAAIRCFSHAGKQRAAEEQAPEQMPPGDNPYASPRGD